MKKTIAFIIVLSFVFCFSISNADENQTNSASKINASFKAGEISREEYIVSKLKLRFSGKKSSVRSKSSVISESDDEIKPTREITLLLREASRNFDSYSQETQEYVAMFLRRPDSSANTWLFEGGGYFFLPEPILAFDPAVDASRYPTISGKMKFWYVDHDTADDAGNVHTTTEGFVRSVADAFETVYNATITTMGYPEPPDDSSVSVNGGDEKIDVYMMDSGSNGVYGYAVSEELDPLNPLNPLNPSRTSFMVLDNDFLEFVTPDISAEQAMQVTAAHEFHHVVQFGINYDASPWIMEATSTWMEDQIYDGVDDNLQYLNGSEGFFEIPHYSLDSSDQFYNAWIWLEYMEVKWGQDSVKSIWTDFLTPGSSNGTLAVENTVNAFGSTLVNSFTEFSMVNYRQTGFYPSEDDYNDVDIANGSGLSLDYSTGTSHLLNSFSAKVNHLAAKYFKFKPGGSILPGDVDSLTINIDGEDGKTIRAVVVVKNRDNSYTESAFPLNSSNNGSIEIDNFSDETISEVVLVLVNPSTNENFSQFVVSGGLDEPVLFFSDILSSDGGSSTCFIESVLRQ